MIAAELPFLLQAHRSQGGGHGSLTGGEDRAYEQQLDMLCQTRLENSGAKGVKSRIIVVGRVRTRSPLFERTGDERTLPPSLQMAKVQLLKLSEKPQ